MAARKSTSKSAPVDPFKGIGVPKKRGRKPGTITTEVATNLNTIRKALEGGKVVCVTNLDHRPEGVPTSVKLVTISKSMDTISGYIGRLVKEGAISSKQGVEGGTLIIK